MSRALMTVFAVASACGPDTMGGAERGWSFAGGDVLCASSAWCDWPVLHPGMVRCRPCTANGGDGWRDAARDAVAGRGTVASLAVTWECDADTPLVRAVRMTCADDAVVDAECGARRSSCRVAYDARAAAHEMIVAGALWLTALTALGAIAVTLVIWQHRSARRARW